jgi:hypothetical protein
MSIFEQYTSNIPLFFPNYDALWALRHEFSKCGVLSELSWNQVYNYNSKSALFAGNSDPNDYLNNHIMMEWAALSDFYDEENMPFIQYYDSFDHLKDLLKTVKTQETSDMMKEHNIQRKNIIYEKWEKVLQIIREQKNSRPN